MNIVRLYAIQDLILNGQTADAKLAIRRLSLKDRYNLIEDMYQNFDYNSYNKWLKIIITKDFK